MLVKFARVWEIMSLAYNLDTAKLAYNSKTCYLQGKRERNPIYKEIADK